MGDSYHSYAQVISTEPEVIKQLIKDIKANDEDDEITFISDLRTEGNLVLFHSFGYGCYGTENGVADVMLFEYLFENYNKALVCFEAIEPCNGIEYWSSASWAKPNGEVDWDDCNTFHIYRRAVFDDPDECNDSYFDIADAWFIRLDNLYSRYGRELPQIKKLVETAKSQNFKNWAKSPYDWNKDDLGIFKSTLWEIDAQLKLDASTAVEEANDDSFYWVSEIELQDLEFELPSTFSELKFVGKEAIFSADPDITLGEDLE